ncbi:3148_t:CDS:10 [Funneliformis geosporum]|nr:3148_t:CDS:10 [Funneliformis geosporum]
MLNLLIFYLISILLIINNSHIANGQEAPTPTIPTPTAPTAIPTTVDEILPYLDPRFYSQLLKNKTVPGTEDNKDACYYVSTPQPEDNIGFGNGTISWSCPAGPDKPIQCTAGFLCPENSAQPVFCCAGYYCNADATEINICPKGSFCAIGTVDPVPCHNLAYCPEGSRRANRYYILALVILAAIVIAILFAVNNKADELKTKKYRGLLKNNEQKMSHEKSLDPVNKTFDIEFENLELVLPPDITIMKGVTGKLSHGRTCAIMGPSGAGKTTFVSLLTGKAKRTNGVIKINGVKENLSKYRKLIGFVPQEDVMLRELTVREILVHSAMMRLPKDMDRAAKKQKVIETIRFLELSHVMDTIIGNEEQRGISGGQRKRVNIGMELVAEPSILFLDEPTSGLDSATSLEVCKLLRNIAHQQKLNVAAVIHSPSPQAFNTFDDFLLLGKGGRIVYFGPRENALDYFKNLGFDCPTDESPADFMMEVASGKVKPSRGETDVSVKDLFKAWEEYSTGGKTTTFGSDKKTPVEIGLDFGTKPGKPSFSFGRKLKEAFLSFHIPFVHLLQDVYYYTLDVLSELFDFSNRFLLFFMRDPIRETPNVFVSFILLFKRASLQLYRNRTQFLLDQLLHIGCGAFISLAASNFTYIGKAPIELCAITPAVIVPACFLAKDTLQSAGVFLALGVTFAGISAGGSTFGYEKVVYWRDTSSGMRTIPYFLSKFIADIPRIALAAFMFSIAFVLFYPFLSKFTELYSIVLLSYWSAWSMGYFLSALVTKEKLGLIGTGFALAWGLVFSGANPKLDEVKHGESYEYIRWLWDISTPRWAVEALYLKELFPRWWYEIHNSPLNYTYSFADYPICLRNIALISMCWATAAFFAMKLFNRDKQK